MLGQEDGEVGCGIVLGRGPGGIETGDWAVEVYSGWLLAVGSREETSFKVVARGGSWTCI
jgi:hypothetical protein